MSAGYIDMRLPRRVSPSRAPNTPLHPASTPHPSPRVLTSRVWALYESWPQSAMTTGLEVLPLWLPTASTALTTSMPPVTEPKTTCLPSSQSVLTVQRKNLRVVYRRRRASL